MDIKNMENEMTSQMEEVLADEEENEAVAAEHEEQAELEREAQESAEDFRREVNELLERYPQLRERFAAGEGLPREVVAVCAQEKIPLRAAYAEYELKAAKTELEQLRKENEILRQNTSAAAKAPVKSAALGGSTNEQRKDPFLDGFFSE